MGGTPPSFNAARAAFDAELLRLTATEPSATPFSTAELSAAGLVAGEKVELFRRLIRWVPVTDPSEAV